MKSYFSISPSTRIVDFGCGPGLYTSEWARMGAAVTGIDVSRRSIEYAMNAARENRLAIRYIRDNYLECPLSGRYDLITLIFCDYCALSPNQRQQLLRRWKSILKPNGNVLFDVSSLKYLDSVHESRTYAFEERGGFWSMGPYHVFLNVHRYEAEKLLLEHYTVVEPNRTRMYYNWLQCFSLETLKTELDNEGFAIRAYFGNVAGDALTEESLEIAVVVTQAT
jgi:SAM-dependent methyltransferase